MALLQVTATYDSSVKRSATLSADNFGVVGRQIDFSINNSNVGSAITNTNGVATLTGIYLTGINTGAYPASVKADFAGDATYSASNGLTDLVVNKMTPVITWSNPAEIAFGTSLSSTQLNATALILGTFVYNPPAGTILNEGTGQILSVSFTPNDTVNYNNASTSAEINFFAC